MKPHDKIESRIGRCPHCILNTFCSFVKTLKFAEKSVSFVKSWLVATTYFCTLLVAFIYHSATLPSEIPYLFSC